MTQRNRSQGWQHAKRSGHRNEDALHDLLLQDRDYQSDFLRRLGAEGSRIAQAEVGGIRETDVPSLLPGRTKSKTDLRLLLDSGEEYRISIKKSLSGQVYLIRDTRFLQGMCLQYGIPIPSEVERAIRLFWGSADDLDQLLPRYATRLAYERRKHRLTADSLYGLDPALSGILPVWFSEHAGLIADLCFSRGLAARPEDWASHIWYKNTLGENPVDRLIPISRLCRLAQAAAPERTCYGRAGGGTTIQLPFGFVQWHQGQMQFHHRYKDIAALLDDAPERLPV